MLLGHDPNGSIAFGCFGGKCFPIPNDLNYTLKDVLEVSVGPKDNNDGIKSCITYNPPGPITPGYQNKRGVSF